MIDEYPILVEYWECSFYIIMESLSGVGESRVVGKEPLRDLDCVEGGAFLDLVADNPET